MRRLFASMLAVPLLGAPVVGGELIKPASERFADPQVQEVPGFQRHVLPLMGRLGCNGRACHGSFQGQAGFRLSLFGYDFKTDHEALTGGDSPRADSENPEKSKILRKPTLKTRHKGGKRMEPDGWEQRVFLRWIEGGAKPASQEASFASLEVFPREIVFEKPGQKVQLKVIVHWSDGAKEDVTCISRFRTNDDLIAEVNLDGVVTSLDKGDTHVVAFYDNGVGTVPVILPVSERVGPAYPDVPTPTRIDELVVEKLRKLGVVPSDPAGDEQFLRRVTLDITGSLPVPAEVEEFLASSSPDKRAKKIDELLERPAYTAWWATKLCDITGNNDRYLEPTFRPEQGRQWYEWIERRVAKNVPYDELVEGIVIAKSRRPGQSYEELNKEWSAYYRDENPTDFAEREDMPHYWLRRNLRQPADKALAFAHAFLGVRIQCARCHKHPFDQWTQQDFNQFSAFFARVRYGNEPESSRTYRQMYADLGLQGLQGGQARRRMREMAKEGKVVPFREVFLTPPRNASDASRVRRRRGQPTRVFTPKLLGGEEVVDAAYDDPREPLMEWMRDRENPYFARAFVNRAWAHYFGVGIIDPPDDQNLANPPSNEALLDYLAKGFVDSGFDMKWVHREIANSRTYQLSWKPNDTNRLDKRNFSHALVRRLPAEVAYDAVVLATASDRELGAKAEDPSQRAIATVSSSYNRGNSGSRYALQIFGRPARMTTCDCERSDEPNLVQAIYLRNDNDVLNLIDRNGGWLSDLRRSWQRANAKGRARRADVKPDALDPDQLVREVYLRTVSRLPNKKEQERARKHVVEAKSAIDGVRDLLWAMLNTKEFIINH